MGADRPNETDAQSTSSSDWLSGELRIIISLSRPANRSLHRGKSNCLRAAESSGWNESEGWNHPARTVIARGFHLISWLNNPATTTATTTTTAKRPLNPPLIINHRLLKWLSGCLSEDGARPAPGSNGGGERGERGGNEKSPSPPPLKKKSKFIKQYPRVYIIIITARHWT